MATLAIQPSKSFLTRSLPDAKSSLWMVKAKGQLIKQILLFGLLLSILTPLVTPVP
jgi:hypothetical protein